MQSAVSRVKAAKDRGLDANKICDCYVTSDLAQGCCGPDTGRSGSTRRQGEISHPPRASETCRKKRTRGNAAGQICRSGIQGLKRLRALKRINAVSTRGSKSVSAAKALPFSICSKCSQPGPAAVGKDVRAGFCIRKQESTPLTTAEDISGGGGR